MFSLKELYRRFKAWQVHPADYPVVNVTRCCNNCGQEYTGKFCPVCGQRATAGRITWQVVHQSVMDVWGLGGRSLPYSLWQLMWRPGYFISDYINGKWQRSFPPVKMLVIVGVTILFITNLLEPGGIVEDDPVTSTGLRYYIDVAFNWLSRNMEWWVLLYFCFLIVPVWSLFRQSPRCPQHTLPQGFYIQVFASTQFLLWMVILYLFDMALLPDGDRSGYGGFLVLIVFVPLLLLIDFRQLFGYGWWGTLWRTALAVPMGLLFLRVIVNFCRVFLFLIESGIGRLVWKTLLSAVDGAAVVWLLMEIVGVINRKEWHEHDWWHVLKRPALAALALLITTGICYTVGQNSSFAGLYRAYLNIINL